MNIFVLTGIAALLAVLIEIAKHFGLIPDGYAGLVAVIANIVVFAIAAIAGYFEFDLAAIDGLAMMLAELLLAILGSWGTHKLGRNMRLW